MKITDSKNAYKAPWAKVLEINAHRVLCQSDPEAKNTEMIIISEHYYGDDDFE